MIPNPMTNNKIDAIESLYILYYTFAFLLLQLGSASLQFYSRIVNRDYNRRKFWHSQRRIDNFQVHLREEWGLSAV
jgi:hypothetical protein